MARISALCEYVDNGDTFRIAEGTWIRLANVCAPESGQPGYEEAKQILATVILNNEIAYEQVDTSNDRLVAKVWLGVGNVNEYMRAHGYTCPPG